MKTWCHKKKNRLNSFRDAGEDVNICKGLKLWGTGANRNEPI